MLGAPGLPCPAPRGLEGTQLCSGGSQKLWGGPQAMLPPPSLSTGPGAQEPGVRGGDARASPTLPG